MAVTRVKEEKWDRQPVPMERWGKDHWSTLLYLETVCVDHRGKVENLKMRTLRRNWRLAGQLAGEANIGSYPTRLKPVQAERGKYDSVELTDGHDDWECMTDMRDAGLLTYEVEEGPRPMKVTVSLTPLGRKYANEARERREKTGRVTPD